VLAPKNKSLKRQLQEMGPIVKGSKKKTKKASAGAGLSSAREEKQVATMITDVQAAWRDEEDLVVYEYKEPPRFSPIEDSISIPEEHTPTPEEGAPDISPLADDLPAFSAEDGPMVGGKRSRFFPALPARQAHLKIPTTLRWTRITTPQVLTMMWR
jgi:hypothetical protein